MCSKYKIIKAETTKPQFKCLSVDMLPIYQPIYTKRLLERTTFLKYLQLLELFIEKFLKSQIALKFGEVCKKSL